MNWNFLDGQREASDPAWVTDDVNITYIDIEPEKHNSHNSRWISPREAGRYLNRCVVITAEFE